MIRVVKTFAHTRNRMIKPTVSRKFPNTLPGKMDNMINLEAL